jgi:hypothetical protein
LSAWIVVFLSLERFLGVKFPFYAGRLAWVRRPGVVIIVLMVCILLLNINVIWATSLIEVGGQPVCVVYSERNWMCRVMPITNMLLYSALPSLLIFALNTAIFVQFLRSVHTVRRARLLTEQSSSSTSSSSCTARSNTALSSRTQRRLTVTLSVICVSWLLLSTPSCLMENIETLASNLLMRSVAYLLLYVNHAIKFYIYCLTGQKFRRELQRTFGCYTPRSRNSKRKHKFVAQPRLQHRLDGDEKSGRRSRAQAKNCAHLYN